jgi:phosphonopyruvate decarboxylase
MKLYFEIKKIIENLGIRDFFGVPDSVLKNFFFYLEKNSKFKINISPNEGVSVGQAIGTYLATKKPACVFLQNAGLGNILNPHISLASKNVYNIPIFYLVGWRGAKNFNDEPQHINQGRITLQILKLLDIKYKIIRYKKDLINLKKRISFTLKNKKSFALVIHPKCFKDKYQIDIENKYSLNREMIINSFLEKFYKNKKNYFFATTGYISRELLKSADKYNIKNIFMCVGGMGHVSSIASSFSNYSSSNKTICFDGDGSILMHMGAMTLQKNKKNKNLIHVLINNGAHESVGGQKINTHEINFNKIALECGYQYVKNIKTIRNLKSEIIKIKKMKKNIFLNVYSKISKTSILPRPNKNLQKYVSYF